MRFRNKIDLHNYFIQFIYCMHIIKKSALYSKVMYNNKIIMFAVSLVAAIIFSASSYANSPEQEFYNKLKELAAKSDQKELLKTAKLFFQKYPDSTFIADVKFLLAENETEPDSAVSQYKTIVDKYKYFKQRDLAQYKICSILYLLSKWNELERESIKGIEIFKESVFNIQFRFFLAKSYLQNERFDKAKQACLDIIEKNHDYEMLSDGLLLLAYADRNIKGLSKEYLNNVSEIITGFKDSGNMPSALFLIGRYYDRKRDFNKAYSAYSDILKDFPKSAEAGLSKERLEQISAYNPSRTEYITHSSNSKAEDKLDIQPEFEINNDQASDIQYSISLGPFYKINDAREIRNLISKDFEPAEIAGVKEGYRIYAGRFNDIDAVLSAKTRLAEEFGINGNIVKIIKDSNKIYIYDE